MKKIVSLLLAVILAASLFIAAPLSAVAAQTGETAKIYFDVESSGWKNYQFIFCHMWACDGSGTWPQWGTRAERCVLQPDGRWAYYLEKTGNLIKPDDGNKYCVMFAACTNDGLTEQRTYQVVMNGGCIGDTVYVTGNTFENPADDVKVCIEADWRNNTECGALKAITSTGNIVGKTLPEGESDESLLAQYILNYRNSDAHMKMVPELLEKLDVTAEDVYAICYERIKEQFDNGTSSPDEAQERLDDIYNSLNVNNSENGFSYKLLIDGTAAITQYKEWSGLTSLVVPSKLGGYSVTKINHGAFSKCFGIENITIPEGITDIGSRAFYRCSSLKNVVIPASVNSIDADAFERCYNLKSINVSSENENYCCENGILYNKDKTVLLVSPSRVTFDDYEFPDSVTAIGDYAFSGCIELDSITIPDSVTSIGRNAFFDCAGLQSVTIPASVTDIGTYALGYDDSYKKEYDFTICGYTGTAANDYAKENGIKFVTFNPETGDINRDTVIDISDATYLQMHLAGYKQSQLDESDSGQLEIADINGDGIIDINDVTAVQKKLAGYKYYDVTVRTDV